MNEQELDELDVLLSKLTAALKKAGAPRSLVQRVVEVRVAASWWMGRAKHG